MEKQRYVNKGRQLSDGELKVLANTGVEVLWIDRDDKEEIVCTIVLGDFVDCTGHFMPQGEDSYSFRFKELSEWGCTYASGIYRCDVYELVELNEAESDKKKSEFISESGVYLLSRHDGECQLVCNQSNYKDYIESLKEGRSFYIQDSKDMLIFSIEKAVAIRNYLSQMIDVAEESGYFENKREMTLEDIEKELGYKIKVV